MSALPPRSSDYLQALAISSKIGKENYSGDFFNYYWRLFADNNLFNLLIPESNYEVIKVIDILMGIGEGCKDFGIALSIGAHCFAAATAINEFASQDIKTKWLPKLRNGTAIAAFAATEEESGSDVMSMKTLYRAENSYYVINGGKHYVTNASKADIIIVFATKNERLYSRGISAFIVPSKTDGIKIENISSYGLQSSPVDKIILKDVKIKKENLLGKINQGDVIFKRSLLVERALLFVPSLGIMRAQIENCLNYARERKQFGKSIGTYQFIREKIVSTYVDFMSCYSLIMNLLPKLTTNKLAQSEASLIKLFLSEAALRVNENILRVLAGNAFSSDENINKQRLDSFYGTVLSGTSDIQKTIIASELKLD